MSPVGRAANLVGPKRIGDGYEGVEYRARANRVKLDMPTLLTSAKVVAGVLLAGVAIAGWGVVFLQDGWLDENERALADLRRAAAVAADKTPAVVGASVTPRGKTGPGKEPRPANTEMSAAEVAAPAIELAAVRAKVEKSRAELDQLQAKISRHKRLLEGIARKYRTTARVNVRARPSTTAEAVAVIPKGRTLQVFEAVEDGAWYKVGGIGFIFHKFLEPVPENARQ